MLFSLVTWISGDDNKISRIYIYHRYLLVFKLGPDIDVYVLNSNLHELEAHILAKILFYAMHTNWKFKMEVTGRP
jgi:hypothetical protein